MIPMAGQAAALLDLVATRSGDAALVSYALRLAPAYRSEAERLRGVLASAGLPETREHDGHDLPGMVTPDDLAALGARDGDGFDTEAVRQLREEMEQSVRLARSERQAGRDGVCLALAAAVEAARTAFLDELGVLLSRPA